MKLRATIGVILLSCVLTAEAADRKFVVTPRPGNMKALPFSDGVLVGNTLYIAGHLGLEPKSGAPPASPEDEARLAMEGVKQTVEAAGLTMDDVVWIQVACADLKLYDTFNLTYRTYFHGDFPARAFLGTDKLLFGARFEVMGIAVRKAQ
jgi:2-iminobutanoate/2-iminopropanoate deaminase